MGTLSQLQSLITIISSVAGFLTVILGIIMSNRVFSMKEKIMEKVDLQFKEMKKEMHDTMVTKEYFTGRLDLMNEKMNAGLNGFEKQLQQFISLHQKLNGKGE